MYISMQTVAEPWLTYSSDGIPMAAEAKIARAKMKDCILDMSFRDYDLVWVCLFLFLSEKELSEE